MQVEDMISELEQKVDTGGRAIDYLQLETQLDFVSRIGNLVIGFLVVLILLVLPIIIALEIIYLVFPPLHEKLRFDAYKDTGYAANIIKLTFRDANRALVEANTIKTGRSPFWLYMWIKLKWILLIVATLALIVNSGTSIVNMFMNLIRGLLDIIFGLTN